MDAWKGATRLVLCPASDIIFDVIGKLTQSLDGRPHRMCMRM